MNIQQSGICRTGWKDTGREGTPAAHGRILETWKETGLFQQKDKAKGKLLTIT